MAKSQHVNVDLSPVAKVGHALLAVAKLAGEAFKKLADTDAGHAAFLFILAARSSYIDAEGKRGRTSLPQYLGYLKGAPVMPAEADPHNARQVLAVLMGHSYDSTLGPLFHRRVTERAEAWGKRNTVKLPTGRKGARSDKPERVRVGTSLDVGSFGSILIPESLASVKGDDTLSTIIGPEEKYRPLIAGKVTVGDKPIVVDGTAIGAVIVEAIGDDPASLPVYRTLIQYLSDHAETMGKPAARIVGQGRARAVAAG